jgi:hypothetical protein
VHVWLQKWVPMVPDLTRLVVHWETRVGIVGHCGLA